MPEVVGVVGGGVEEYTCFIVYVMNEIITCRIRSNSLGVVEGRVGVGAAGNGGGVVGGWVGAG